MATITLQRNRLSLRDESGVELAYNTVRKTGVTPTHIQKLVVLAGLLRLGEVHVDEGLPAR